MKPKPERVIINGVPHRLVVFEVIGLFPNGKFRYVKRLTEESTTGVATPKPKWFVTGYVQEGVLRASHPNIYTDPRLDPKQQS